LEFTFGFGGPTVGRRPQVAVTTLYNWQFRIPSRPPHPLRTDNSFVHPADRHPLAAELFRLAEDPLRPRSAVGAIVHHMRSFISATAVHVVVSLHGAGVDYAGKGSSPVPQSVLPRLYPLSLKQPVFHEVLAPSLCLPLSPSPAHLTQSSDPHTCRGTRNGRPGQAMWSACVFRWRSTIQPTCSPLQERSSPSTLTKNGSCRHRLRTPVQGRR